MLLFRIILSLSMALFVAMPMCVCGNTHQTDSIICEHSCCLEHESDDEPEGCGHNCSHHDTLEYLPAEFKILLPSALTLDHSIDELILNLFSHLECPYQRPPPDRFANNSRSVTYCIYRL